MSRIIIHKRKSGKYDYTITGDDVNESILVSTVQGFERKAEARNNLMATFLALQEYLWTEQGHVEQTHAQYTEWRRQHRNQLARNRRARGKK